MKVKLKNIVWVGDSPELPNEAVIEMDGNYIEELVKDGVDREGAIDQVLYEDLPESFDADVISFEVVSIEP